LNKIIKSKIIYISKSFSTNQITNATLSLTIINYVYLSHPLYNLKLHLLFYF